MVGAPGYVKKNYSGAKHQLVLCAVGPEDVVAVPTDYDGEKMRVCKYTVIDHLSQDYNDELLGRLRGTQTHGYTHQEPTPPVDTTVEVESNLDDYARVVVGDVVCHTLNLNGEETYALVVEIDDGDDLRLRIRPIDGEETWLPADEYVSTVPADDVVASMLVCEQARVRIEGHPVLRDGDYLVVEPAENDAYSGATQDDGDQAFFRVAPIDLRADNGDDGFLVTNGNIMAVTYEGLQLWPRNVITTADMVAGEISADKIIAHTMTPLARQVTVGDRVQLTAGHPPHGIYPVLDVCPTGVIVETEHDGKPFVGFDRIQAVFAA